VPDFTKLFWPMAGAFVSLVAAGFGAPIPEEIPTIGAAIWVASSPELGPLRWLILLVCFIGILISDTLLYGIGRLWGTKLLQHRWTARLMPPGRREQIEANFERYGVKILLLVRWVPGIRSPMFVTAGTMRLTFHRFIIADAIAAAIGHSLLFFLAYWFGDQFKDLVSTAENKAQSYVRPLLILGAILAVAIYLVFHFWKRPVTVGDPKEVPLIGPRVAAKIEQSGMWQATPGPNPTKEPSANGVDSEQIKKTTTTDSATQAPLKQPSPPKTEPSANGEEKKESPEKSQREQR
jgi:membrane protein DedA with SNARE-associated domain